MFREQFLNFLGDFFEEGKRILLEDITSILPDLVGYTAIFCGAFIILCPLLNRSILQPLGIFATVGICCASVLGAA